MENICILKYGERPIKKNENDFKKRGFNLWQKSSMLLTKSFSSVGFSHFGLVLLGIKTWVPDLNTNNKLTD